MPYNNQDCISDAGAPAEGTISGTLLVPSAGRNAFSGNDRAVSLRDSIAREDCLSGNRPHGRTPSS